MSCNYFVKTDTRQSGMASHEPAQTKLRAAYVETLFEQLSGSWSLDRRLQSANASEPAGKCTGTATFTPREPSVFINKEGSLETAAAELVYHEQGHFELQQAPTQLYNPRFGFSRKYIWRLHRQVPDNSAELSIWFTQPGTEKIDYLFHKVNVTMGGSAADAQHSTILLHGDGGHLCEEDIYSSEYTFELIPDRNATTQIHDSIQLKGWRMLHEVRGPNKEQVIETLFSRDFPMDSIDQVKLPQLFASIPRHPLLFGPSYIQSLPRISAALGGKVAVYAKRDDCNSGIAYGGNKTRKLEYLVPDALSQGCDTLVSIGGFQSNHTRQVAGVAAALGLKAKLVQEKWVDWEDPGYAKVGNIQLSRLMSADVRLDSSGFGIEHKESLRQLFEEVTAAGGKGYYIPAGASDHPLGGLGFARWAFEVHQQEQMMGTFFDTIIVCAVTGSTFAGMIAGFKLLEKEGLAPHRKVIGIDASAKPKETFDQVLQIAKQTGIKIGLGDADIQAEDVILDTRYHGGIYGIPDQTTIDAIKFGASTEAFITDPVYEGKSLAGMMDMIKNGDIPAGSKVLYAHLGGQLALNAYSDLS